MTDQQNSPGPPHQTNQSGTSTDPFDIILDRVRRSVYPISSILIGVIVIVFIIGLFQAFRSGEIGLLDRLKDEDFARGVITFLIALGTIALALIVAVAGLMRGQPGEDPEQQAKRFNRGKEVLTVLVGILGTIIGFYYGSADGRGNDSPEPEVPALVLETVEIPTEVQVGTAFTIRGKVKGGTPPYQVALDFEPDDVFADIDPQEAPDGVAEVPDLTAPPDSAGNEVVVTLVFTDSAAGRLEEERSITVRPPPS